MGGKLVIWDFNMQKIVHVEKIEKDELTAVGMSSDGLIYITAHGQFGKIRKWSINKTPSS